MNKAAEYQRKVLSHVEAIRDSGNRVIIFGADRAGWYIMQVLEHFGVPIAAYCDNDPKKQTRYAGYRVMSLESTVKEVCNPYVFIGTFRPDTAHQIEGQLHDVGYMNIHWEMPAFLYMYFAEVAGRQCDMDVLARSIYVLFENYKERPIHYGWLQGKYYVSPFVTSVITQKCSLRCRDCSQRMPYYKNPVHFSVETVIRDLKQYAKAFDVIPEISLQGGEPFLHPQLEEICMEVASISNIVFISFVTNGTIMRSDDTWRVLSRCGADVHQSGGYGSLSKKRDDLFEAFKKHNIYSDVLFCNPSGMWSKAPPFKKHHRSAEENDTLYVKCTSSKICCQLMDGELHRCTVSMHGSHQGLIPKEENDYVRLDDPEMDEEILVRKIRDFLDRRKALSACDYCDPDGSILVPPAIQLTHNHT